MALFFLVHLLIHAVAQGLIFTPDGYLLELWNAFDTFLLIVDLLSLISHPGGEVGEGGAERGAAR